MRVRLSKTPLLLVTCVLSLLLCASPAMAKKQHGFYWGAWIGSQLTGTQPPWDMSAVTRFQKTVHHSLSLVEFAAPFANCSTSPCSFSPFPAPQMQSIRDYGAIPFLSWSSGSTPASVDQPEFQLADIIDGTYDEYIRGFATEAAAWGHPFFLRFDWEMNGNWFGWAEGANGNRAHQFVAAWRHVHDIFVAAGATNATWVWCPYANTKGRYGKLANYYPGDRYVDWTSLDGYNFGKTAINPHRWKPFDHLYKPAYDLITREVAPNKPMLLSEIASNGPSQAKATWIRQMFKSLVDEYPQVGGLIWFDQFDRGINWPIETSPATIGAFSFGLKHYPFLGRSFGNLAATPIPWAR